MLERKEKKKENVSFFPALRLPQKFSNLGQLPQGFQFKGLALDPEFRIYDCDSDIWGPHFE